MHVTLKTEEKEKRVKTAAAATIADVLEAEKLNQETFLIKLNGKLAHEETPLKEGDVIECWNVVYGG